MVSHKTAVDNIIKYKGALQNELALELCKNSERLHTQQTKCKKGSLSQMLLKSWRGRQMKYETKTLCQLYKLKNT